MLRHARARRSRGRRASSWPCRGRARRACMAQEHDFMQLHLIFSHSQASEVGVPVCRKTPSAADGSSSDSCSSRSELAVGAPAILHVHRRMQLHRTGSHSHRRPCSFDPRSCGGDGGREASERRCADRGGGVPATPARASPSRRARQRACRRPQPLPRPHRSHRRRRGSTRACARPRRRAGQARRPGTRRSPRAAARPPPRAPAPPGEPACCQIRQVVAPRRRARRATCRCRRKVVVPTEADFPAGAAAAANRALVQRWRPRRRELQSAAPAEQRRKPAARSRRDVRRRPTAARSARTPSARALCPSAPARRARAARRAPQPSSDRPSARTTRCPPTRCSPRTSTSRGAASLSTQWLR